MNENPGEILELQARDAYTVFMECTYGNKFEDWNDLPRYAREGWRQVILRQDIETDLGDKYHLVMIDGRPRIANKQSGQVIPEDEPVMIFRARDHHALATLRRYDELCLMDGCTAEHLAGIGECFRLFNVFRNEHPERMKRPGDPAGKMVYSATSESPTVSATMHPPECRCEICQELRK